MVLHKKKLLLTFERIQRIATMMVPYLEDQTYEQSLKEMQLTTLKKKKRKREDLITIHKFDE